jgi:cytochrome c peroxidase
MVKKILLIAISGVLMLSSCRKEKEIDVVAESSPEYDQALKDAIMGATQGIGESALILPEETQYSQIPQDPLNPITAAKVELGKFLFHETQIASEAKYTEGMSTFSCSSCHFAQAGFFSNVPQGVSDGGVGFGVAGEGRVFNPNYSLDSLDLVNNRTPSILNTAYQKVMLYNGQFGAEGVNNGTENLWPPNTPIWNNQFGHEGVETQAIAGLTVHRMMVDEEFCETYPAYEQMFNDAFPDWPQQTRISQRTAGLAVAAYERTVLPNKAPFQDWLKGDTEAMSPSEKRGAILFFGEANCFKCHNGPGLNKSMPTGEGDTEFYALGFNNLIEGPRVHLTVAQPTEALGRGSFTQDPDDYYTFKTPQLYNLADSPFYGHGSSFTSVRDVVEYKNNAVAQNPQVPTTQLDEEFVPLGLTSQQVTDITNFIELSLHDDDLMRYVPIELPTGNCFPNNDLQAQIDQGCVQ